ncbi:MAG: glutaminase A [Pseudomonadota bacterium]
MKTLTQITLGTLLVAGLFIFSSLAPLHAATGIDAVLKKVYEKYRDLEEGANANYIPALADMDPDLFGIVLVTVDGDVHSVGDVGTEVSIQSISKVFTMARVMEESGTDAIFNNMGVDATGQVFNSIVAIEQYQGQEMNAMVNPGAIATTSMIKGANEKEVWETIIGTHNDFAGRRLSVLEDVYKSEAETNQRNQALAMLMHAYGRIEDKPIEATDIYTRQCSIGVNARDLATMAATLASGGRNPVTGKQVISSKHIPEVLAVMATAGLYDDSGQWLYKTGLPAKSGVGGGILAVSPGKFGIAAISPPLDEAGNSIRAQRAIADISNALCGNPYDPVQGDSCAGAE